MQHAEYLIHLENKKHPNLWHPKSIADKSKNPASHKLFFQIISDSVIHNLEEEK